MASEVVDVLVFFVNGKKVIERFPDPEASLLQYLRRTLLLPGTKEGCGHGGCGSCTVMVSRMVYEDKQLRHYTVNACLFPLCAAHGLAITTVEGVGNPRTGLHEVQRRLIESHGLQCGFCTPGFVMSVFTLLRNNPSPTRNELEKSLEGNLCRCTGYRPIVQAFNTLCQDACPQGDLCCKNQRTSPLHVESANHSADQSLRGSDSTQVAIFPAELQLSDKYSSSLVKFVGPNWTWIRPITFEDLLAMKNEHPEAPIIMGNTLAALHLKLGRFRGKHMIYGGGVSSLKTVEVLETGISLGAGLTIGEMEQKLKEITGQIPEERRRHFPALQYMIEKYGADQIRNSATISGSIMSGQSNSDITTIFAGLGALVNIQSMSTTRTDNIEGLTLDGKEVIKSVVIPFTDKNEFIMFHKLADRNTFSLALQNTCMYVRLSETGTIERLRMAFGGIEKKLLVIEKIPKTEGRTPYWLGNKKWGIEVLENVLAGLPEFLKCYDGQSDTNKHKLAVAAGFFYKFYEQVKHQLNQDPSSGPGALRSQDSIGIVPCCGTQQYEPFTNHSQIDSDTLHRPVPNVSSEAIVSGEAVYVDDMPTVKGELFLALVTSKRAHAKIVHIDASAALLIPGVLGFIDHRDIPGQNKWGALVPEEELLASEEVTYYGQPIGAIVAETREIARHAIWLVKIEYQDLKAVLSIEEAIKDNSFYDANSELAVGNLEDGFRESDDVIEGEYSTGFQEHFYLEPFSCIVMPRRENDEMDVYVTTQNLASIQVNLSRFLGVPNHKIHCSVKRLGGAFGGKQTGLVMIAGPAAVAAQKYDRPVRSVLSREMDMEITGKRHPYLAKYKVGVTKCGKIRALDIHLYANGGSSLGVSGLILLKTTADFNGGYRIENLKVSARACKTNVPSSIPFRAFGPAEGLIIMEDIIFKIACSLDLPQESVREANFFKQGDLTKYGIPLVNCPLEELWNKCGKQSNFKQRMQGTSEFNRQNRWKKRGIVMTAGRYSIGWPGKHMYQGTAVVSIYRDGTVLLTHGRIEMGQGINTKMIQIASRELSVPTDLIYTSDSNTKSTPNSIISAGSMGTDIYGPAVVDACQIMNERLKPVREANPGVPWQVLIEKAFFNRVKLTATGFSRYPKEQYDPVSKTGSKADYYTNGVVCTEVEIDVLTGENQVLQSDIVMDVGKSLNPAIDIGQIEGAFVQGLGMVTTEYIDVDERGKMINCSPVSYKIPNVRSIPRKFNVSLVQEDNVVTPVYSAKAVGEPPLLLSISVIMAIKEAIKAARAEIGLHGYFRLDSPATVERIRRACGDQLANVKD